MRETLAEISKQIQTMNKIQTLLKLIFLFLSFLSFAQNDNELSRHKTVNEFVESLVQRKIDTICDYEVFTEKTDAMYTQYVFWRENGKTKIKKLELEHNYKLVQADADEIWKNLLENKNVIQSEKVQSFSYVENNEIQEVISQGNHFREFNLLTNGKMVKFWTSSYDFQKNDRFGGRKVENLYYDHNNNLKGKFVLDQFEIFLKKLERQNFFKE